MQPHIFVVYDSIKNSIFVSQVLNPLIAQLKANEHDSVIIVSFELRPVDPAFLALFATHPRLTIKIIPRSRFWSRLSLRYPQKVLHSFLGDFGPYFMTARGPLAGQIARKALTPTCQRLTIQARGLAAQEYQYAHKSFLFSWIHAIRFHQYESLERCVYGMRDPRIVMEVVSTALKEYLITHFNADPKKITIATRDIPSPIPDALKTTWRNATRTKLGIDQNALVYCYNGSALPWQCPEETIEYFCAEYKKNKNSFLLLLTRDVKTFRAHIDKTNLPSDCYHLCSVAHADVCRYLAACDVGILFRKPHTLNWVSRPTKLLEYQSVGLKIAHNNTIACLVEK